jgi:hypothetical protein
MLSSRRDLPCLKSRCDNQEDLFKMTSEINLTIIFCVDMYSHRGI